jgi:GT2 family glycosyltransferase
MTAEVYAIVLNWNGYEDTAMCLESLRGINSASLNVIVVDNGSEDGSGEKLDENFPDIQVEYNSENEGFAGGMNTGIKTALAKGADYIWLLNNDTVIPEENQNDIVDRIIQPLKNRSNVVITSPVITRYDSNEVWFDEGKIDMKTLNSSHRGSDHKSTGDRDDLIFNDYIPLCCAMVDGEFIEEIGLLEERYFFYHEDIDLGLQTYQRGDSLATVTDFVVEHKVAQSAGGDLDPLHSYYAARNRILIYKKFSQTTSMARFWPSYVIWLVLLAGNRIVNFRLDGLLALFAGCIDGLQSNMGKGPYP